MVTSVPCGCRAELGPVNGGWLRECPKAKQLFRRLVRASGRYGAVSRQAEAIGAELRKHVTDQL